MKTIAITGATGLLGRNILFEFIKLNRNNLDELKVVIFGRSIKKESLRKRTEKIVVDDGMHYIYNGSAWLNDLSEFMQNNVCYVESNLDKENLGISKKELQLLKTMHIDFFFHSAANTDLRNNKNLMDGLMKSNVYGTEQALKVFERIGAKEFCYMSTAYACGKTSGTVQPDEYDPDRGFRCNYEHSKLLAELKVREYGEKTKNRIRIFRPSSICGRLIEGPMGSMPKFDVFYFWGAFFLKMKLNFFKVPYNKRYDEKISSEFRIVHHPIGGLNIVPADYSAKVISQVCLQDAPGDSFHVVNKKEAPHGFYLPLMLKAINMEGEISRDSLPDKLNPLESIYYRTVGGLYHDYLTSAPIHFDTSNIEEIENNAGLKCPEIDETNFTHLMDFAKQKDFGLSLNVN